MGAKLTPDLIGAYLVALHQEAVSELKETRAALAHAIVQGKVYEGLYAALWRRQERLDWLVRLLAARPDGSIPPPVVDLAYHVHTIRMQAHAQLLDFNPAGLPPLVAAQATAQKVAIRHVYDDLEPGSIELWLRQNDRLEGDGSVQPSEIEALASGDGEDVARLAKQALGDDEPALAVALMRGIAEDGSVRAGYLLSLAAERAQASRPE
jgi:hypothetical protein